MACAIAREHVPEIVRQQFPGTGGRVYLNSAAEGLFLESNRGALTRYADAKELGSDGREIFATVEACCRGLMAEIFGVNPIDIAFLASTARGLDVAIKSIDWLPGDNIVFADNEFPTTAFAANHLTRSGVERRLVRSQAGVVGPDMVAEKITDRTRLVVVSAVSYKTGFKIDVPAVAQVVHARGSLLFVDAIQAAGSVDIDVSSADFACAGTYKWLLGAHGLAAFYVSPSLLGRIQPPYVAYRGVEDLFAVDRFENNKLLPDARRFEEGMPNYAGLFVLQNALTFLLSTGIKTIAAHNARLVERLMTGLRDLAVAPLTPDSAKHRGAIVSFETEHPSEVVRHLAAAGVSVWGRDGRVRLSPHFYNVDDDIDYFLHHLSCYLEGTRS